MNKYVDLSIASMTCKGPPGLAGLNITDLNAKDIKKNVQEKNIAVLTHVSFEAMFPIFFIISIPIRGIR